MTRDSVADLDVRLVDDECGERLLLGVESGPVKLAVIVPENVPRTALETATADCVRELAGHLEGASGREQPSGGRERRRPGSED